MAELPDLMLFDFDKDKLVDWDQERVDRFLADEPTAELYRHHLTVAQGLALWAMRHEEDAPKYCAEPEFTRGYNAALLEIAALLRQGSLMPGEHTYDDWIAAVRPSASQRRQRLDEILGRLDDHGGDAS